MDPTKTTLPRPDLQNQNDNTGNQNDDNTTTITNNNNNNNYTNNNNNNNNNKNNNNRKKVSIAERRAAKCGFKAEKINTARFRIDNSLGSINSPLSSPVVWSPLITIPPGISPTALLDSPVLLPNSLASPTTGTFPFPLKAEKDLDDGFLDFCSLLNQGNNGDLQSLLSAGPSMDFEFPLESPKEATIRILDHVSDTGPKTMESKIIDANCSDLQVQCSDLLHDTNCQQKEPANGECIGVHLVEEQNENFPAADMGRTSEDGYNWRKYGQKQVKGSEYPRSYYKCTHLNCQVKKKIERSHDGQITEIIYKGAHNHPKPQPNRRATPGSASSFDGMPEVEEDTGTNVKLEGGMACLESGSKDVNLGSDRRINGLERTSSASVVTELTDPLLTTKRKSVGAFEWVGTPELSSSVPSLDDNDDGGTTQASISVGGDADDEESESKRRKLESLVEMNVTSRAVREPRVVVQIESEVDILDDGYRWRKYGQKVVKGNPNPRSYYKCTSPGCSVRKHVERASHDLKYVITTYEGKHNHEVPAAKNSSHTNSSSGNLPPNPSNAQHGLALGKNSNGPKPEPHIQDYAPSFDRNPVFHNYLRPSFPRNFSNDVRLGASSNCSMKFPSIQNTMPYGPFGCNSNPAALHHSGSMASIVPDFLISGHSSCYTSSNLCLAAIDFQNKGKVVGPMQTFLSGQQLIRPKQEQKDNMYDVCPSMVDRTNVSSSSAPPSFYQHIMRNFSS